MHWIKNSILILVAFFCYTVRAQEITIKVNPEKTYQTLEGFGAALAYYENWLTAHPYKSEIYKAVFDELSLDILRVRNAYGYDDGMIDRVKEFINASKTVRGTPIPFLTTSWGPPAYLKSNNDRNSGGTLKYTVADGKVTFDYEGFANWWNESLDNYEKNGVFPTYVSIQNEPDFKATYESCLLNPFEKVNSKDTLAGYNIALKAVYDKISTRAKAPKLLGPECIGIGYNAVKNYVLQLDTTLLAGVAHHLYHGVDVDNPWDNSEMASLRKLYSNLKLFQTEYSGNDWFNLSGLMYKSLAEEQVSAYFYWDLIWDNSGLISLDNPWNNGSWSNTKGYTKTKRFYSFKQFSAFSHPGWKGIEVTPGSTALKTVAFMSPGKDSLSVVVINRSTGSEKELHFDLGGFEYVQSELWSTSDNLDCELLGSISDLTCTVSIKSISTAFFTKTPRTNVKEKFTEDIKPYPNPFNNYCQIKGIEPNQDWILYCTDGSLVKQGQGPLLDGSEIKPGAYILKVKQQNLKLIKK